MRWRGNSEAAFRTSLVRTTLKLDTKADPLSPRWPSTSICWRRKRHTAAGATRSTPPDKPPRIKGTQAAATSTADSAPAPKAKASPSAPPPSAGSQKLCKSFAKGDGGCRRGSECQFVHEWGTTPKSGRCLICSSTSHVKKECPTKDKSAGGGQRARGEQQQASSSSAAPTTKVMNTHPDFLSSFGSAGSAAIPCSVAVLTRASR